MTPEECREKACGSLGSHFSHATLACGGGVVDRVLTYSLTLPLERPQQYNDNVSLLCDPCSATSSIRHPFIVSDHRF